MKKLRLIAVFYALLAMATFVTTFTPPSAVSDTCANYILAPEPTLLEPIRLVLPHTSPWFGRTPEDETLIVTKLPFAGPVRWQGMVCDQVWLPVGSEIRAINYRPGFENWLFTVRPDGYLDYRWAPLMED